MANTNDHDRIIEIGPILNTINNLAGGVTTPGTLAEIIAGTNTTQKTFTPADINDAVEQLDNGSTGSVLPNPATTTFNYFVLFAGGVTDGLYARSGVTHWVQIT